MFWPVRSLPCVCQIPVGITTTQPMGGTADRVADTAEEGINSKETYYAVTNPKSTRNPPLSGYLIALPYLLAS